MNMGCSRSLFSKALNYSTNKIDEEIGAIVKSAVNTELKSRGIDFVFENKINTEEYLSLKYFDMIKIRGANMILSESWDVEAYLNNGTIEGIKIITIKIKIKYEGKYKNIPSGFSYIIEK